MGASKNTPSSNKKEEKRREWTDKNEQVKFVCEGAKVQCKYCNPPIANLIVTTESVKISFGQLLVIKMVKRILLLLVFVCIHHNKSHYVLLLHVKV